MEIYVSSPWYVEQPFGEPLDLTLPADAVRAKTEAMVRKDPTWRHADEWSEDLRKKQFAVSAV